jgi:dipeptidase D
MEYVVNGYEPREVFEIFEDICAIPHGSGNEKGVADYIVAFAEKRGLFCLRDDMNNVFVRKNATEGYENTPAILFQGHTDMVCEKNADSDHDFLRDGLKLSVKDGYLWADGTTLGADNGIAVAMMLALLDTDKHPTIELLFTVEEETGLFGAQGFDCSVVTAKRMINLDSEEDDQVTAGCAGGNRSEITFEFERVPAKESDLGLNVSVTGLSGGHSGAEIHLGKTNANILMGRLLSVAYKAAGKFNIVQIHGGGKDNAIARECFATLRFENAEAQAAAKKALVKETLEVRKEINEDDKELRVDIGNTNASDYINDEITEKIIAFMTTLRTEVIKMSNQIKGLVEYSRNLGVIVMDESSVRFIISARSSLEAQLDMSIREIDALSKLVGADCRHYARYPGWEFQPASLLREQYIEKYKFMFGKEPTVGVIHAGLECGILSSKMPGMDIISIGPNMHDIHSPNEHLDLASTGKVWQAVLAVIQEK